MLDRTIAPSIKLSYDIEISQAEEIFLGNGIPVYLIKDDTEDVLRIDFIIGAGSWNQEQILSSYFVSQMLNEGNESMNAEKIAEQLDFYGSWMQTSNTYHHHVITFYTLKKYFEQTMEVAEPMFKSCTFPINKLRLKEEKAAQNWAIRNEKVQTIAHTMFMQNLYGKNHPYGRVAKREDYEKNDSESLKRFYQKYYNAPNCMIVLSGKINDETIKILERDFGGNDWNKGDKCKDRIIEINQAYKEKIFTPKKNTIQSAVTIGRKKDKEYRKDYFALKILNVVLGGYFGSRLMQTVREEKGYTYGIYSSLSSKKYGGELLIEAQTANKYVDPLIKETFAQMEILRNKLIDKDELNMLRNYLSGNAMRSYDGLFGKVDGFISMKLHNLTPKYLKEKYNYISIVQPEDLRTAAIKYLNPEDFFISIAGNQ